MKSKKPAARRDLVVVENVNHPGKKRRADATHYNAMRRAVLKVLPRRSPGLDYARMTRAVLPHLPANGVPGRRARELVAEDRSARPRGQGDNRARENEAASLAALLTEGKWP